MPHGLRQLDLPDIPALMMAGIRLPAFPTATSLNDQLLQTIESTLHRYYASSTDDDSETYIATFAKHRAYTTLISGADSTFPEAISQLTLLIAQRTTRLIAIHTLIDLSIIYAHSYPTQIRQLFQAQYSLYPSQLIHSITNDVLPTFTKLLVCSDTHQDLLSFSQYCFCFYPPLPMRCPFVLSIRPFSCLTFLQDIQQRATSGSACGNVSAT